MNMQAYKSDTAWNRGMPSTFYKILIQIYLLCSFLYSLTYFIKEGIKGDIFWRLNEKVPVYEADTACIKKVIKGKIFWILNEKSAGLWGNYGLKQGNLL